MISLVEKQRTVLNEVCPDNEYKAEDRKGSTTSATSAPTGSRTPRIDYSKLTWKDTILPEGP